MSPEEKDSFERAFSSGCSGCRRICNCGKEFYDTSDNSWDWEAGEFEALEKSDATPLGYSVGSITFQGKEYVFDCECWTSLAEKAVNFIDDHKHQIARFLSLEKHRKQKIADDVPTVKL